MKSGVRVPPAPYNLQSNAGDESIISFLLGNECDDPLFRTSHFYALIPQSEYFTLEKQVGLSWLAVDITLPSETYVHHPNVSQLAAMQVG